METSEDYSYLSGDMMAAVTLPDQSSADHTSIL
jgi:hypothetical protein